LGTAIVINDFSELSPAKIIQKFQSQVS